MLVTRLQLLLVAVCIVLAVTITTRPTPATAPTAVNQQCPSTVYDRLIASDVVLTGRVFIVMPSGPLGAQAVVDPIAVFHGQVTTPTIVVNAVPSNVASTGTGGLNLVSGETTYLLYLQRLSDGTFTTSTCAGSRVANDGLTTEEQAVFKVVAA